ncbi:serine/threonine protein kinase [Coemansia biformis]|uniref:non-specific serine/threonine protein kinase n=1 Tax=Coemansia biformis TaxID=1286918 RepID=A0A9W8CZ49_9FUNG|nr:serine/threonine protein kinase [Coemansia biformis]
MESVSLELRGRPRIPPKPANLRPNNPPPAQLHAALAAADSAGALNSAGDSPARSMQSATQALDAAAATPRTASGVLSLQHRPHHDQGSAAGEAPPAQPAASGARGPPHDSTGRQSARKRAVTDFEFGQTLGEGSYSTVVEATEKATGRVYAAKILDKRHIIKEKKIKYVNIERDILQALLHPFIVRLHYAFQDSQSLYFVIDLASNGELLSWIRKLGGLSEDCARFYLAEIIEAVEYMHMERTLHRDIKPENILLGSDMHILVTDFGTAKMFKRDEAEQRAYSFVGTAEYVSPELLTDKAADRNSDLWAVACVAYQLLTGRPPFKGSNEYQTFQKVLKLNYSFPPDMPPHARDLIERILVLEPENRLGSTQRGGFGELKAHPFFQDFDWHDLPSRTPPPMAGAALATSEPPRVMPPAIPPKPALLRQLPPLVGAADDPGSGLYDTRHSSSDGFGTEKTSDDSFSATPAASTDPLAAAQLPSLIGYLIAPPISPRQTPVHIASNAHSSMARSALPPPPPPPHGMLAAQPAAPFPAYSHLSSHAADASGIYNVRLNDHVPPPLKAEEMAEVESYHRSNGRPPQPLSPSTTDYYANASYRPPGQPHHSVYSNSLGRAGGRVAPGGIGGGRGDSWVSRLKSTLCCGS